MKNYSRAIIMFFVALLAPCTAAAEKQKPAVIFDQGHGQRFLIESSGELQLSNFASRFRALGITVRSVTVPLTAAALQDVSALVISGPFKVLTAVEVEAVISFMEQGGRVAAMLHIGKPLENLLDSLKIAYSNASLGEQKNIIGDNPSDFRVRDLSAHPLFEGLEQFSVYGAWAINPGSHASAIARTSSLAWADLNGDKALSRGDMVGAFPVVVTGEAGLGRFVIIGDDALFQNRYLDEDNRRLADNLARWLTGP